jgi:hypothetical protein
MRLCEEAYYVHSGGWFNDGFPLVRDFSGLLSIAILATFQAIGK